MKKNFRLGMLIIYSFLLLILTVSLGKVVIASEKELVKPWAKVWEGEITILRTGIQDFKDDNSDQEKSENNSIKRSLNEEICIKICGMSGDMYVKEVSHNLLDKCEEESFLQFVEETCDYPEEATKEHNALYIQKHFDKETKSPGSSTRSKSITSEEIYHGWEMPSERKNTSVKLNFSDSEHFTIGVQNSVYIAFSSESTTRSFSVCSGHTSIFKSTRHTGTIGQEEKHSYQETGEGDSKNVISETIFSPEERNRSFGWEGSVTGDSFSGSKEIDWIDIPPELGGYSETTVAKWNFTTRDVCSEVGDRLLMELAFCEAYLDKDLQDFASSIKEYESLVYDQAYKILTGSPAPRSDGSSSNSDSDEMWVNPETCQMENEDEFLERVMQQCLPYIIFDSVKAHENTHLQQCEKFNEEMNAGDPHIKGLMEATAYINGAYVLLDWLEENCPNREIESLKERLEKLEEAKFRRYE
ncbi:MAG TPA: hypothetical protein ENO17_03515 [Candidatus Atribacteria bacterium]|nr:hypothetical protein [Candidatus Atribacteria bacterium]